MAAACARLISCLRRFNSERGNSVTLLYQLPNDLR